MIAFTQPNPPNFWLAPLLQRKRRKAQEEGGEALPSTKEITAKSMYSMPCGGAAVCVSQLTRIHVSPQSVDPV